MSLFLKSLGVVVFVLVIAAGVPLYFLYLEPRPQDTTEARVYEDDAYAVDYCSREQLNGSGLGADDIPKAYTAECDIDRWPAPVLAGCTEPLPPEAVAGGALNPKQNHHHQGARS